MPTKVTYKDLYSQVVEEIRKENKFLTFDKFNQQLQRSGVAPLAFGGGGSLPDISAGQIIAAVQNLLQEALPPSILTGLQVTATSPATDYVTVSAGSGSVGGKLYTLASDTELRVPFDEDTEIYFINLYLDRIMVEKTIAADKLTIAKINVPNPGTTSRIFDHADDADIQDGDAYIQNFTEFKLYGINDKLEEDSKQILKNNIGDILADTIVGNLTLSENLKITNTQGTLELDSRQVLIKDVDGNTSAKFNKDGTFFYNSDGQEVAKFSVGGAKIGNINITPTTIQSGNFVSGALGAGFQIKDDGDAEFNNIRARGKLTATVFEKDTISVVGGSVLVMDGDILDADMTTSDSSTLTITGDTTFAVGDILRIKDGVDDEWLEVTNISNAPTYTVTRDRASQYSANSNPAWTKGTSVVNYKQSGDGGVFMTSSESNAPYISILTHAGSPWSATTTHARFGNLNGYLDYVTDAYGIGIGDATDYMTYDPTNGLRIRGSITITGGDIPPKTYYQNDEPPTSGQTNPNEGDYWVDTNDSNNLYVFSGGDYGESGAAWSQVASTGGSGANVFYQTEEPSGQGEQVGDFWVDTDDQNNLYTYNGSAGWVEIASDTATGVSTYAQASAPSSPSEGDLWIDTDDDNKLYRYNGSSWVSVRDAGIADAIADAAAASAAASTAQATADGKIVTFYQDNEPDSSDSPSDGDLWIDTNDGNKLYRYAESAGWLEIQDDDIATAITNAATAQSTADGKIVTYYQDDQPGGGSEGDLWIDTNDGNKLYRYSDSGGWTSVQDAQIATAISDAATAQATADGKVTTFYQTSAPTAEGTGDLWVDTDDGNKLYRWSGSVWTEIQDQDIVQALSDAATAQSTADGKIVSYYQDDAPGAGSEGDFWVDTNDGNKLYRHNGSSGWVAVQDADIATALADAATAISNAATAQATADGKITTFYQTSSPTAEGVGDLWVDTDDGNKLYRWNGSSWQEIQDQDIVTALSDAATAQSTADGKIQSFYQDDEPGSGDNVGYGDIWVDTNDGNKMYIYQGSLGWVSAQDIGAKVFYQTGEPSGQGEKNGDFWIDTDDNSTLYVRNSGTWELAQDNTGGSGITTFYQGQSGDGIPTSTSTGDLWFDTEENKLYRAESIGADQITAGEWVLVPTAGTDDDGNLTTKVLPGSNVGTPSGSGLYLGADYMGYFDSTLAGQSGETGWKSYIDNTGQFYFCGDESNYVAWDGAMLSVRGTLNADDITAGSIVGRDICTASSGSRIEMSTTCFSAYDDSSAPGNETFKIGLSGPDAGSVFLGDQDTNNYAKWCASEGSFNIFHESTPVSSEAVCCVRICGGNLYANDICLVDPNDTDVYSYLSAGQWYFQDTRGCQTPYVKRIESGTACTGDTVTLAGWSESPTLMVGIKDLDAYQTSYSGQDQRWCVYHDNVVSYDNSAMDYGYTFDVHAQLQLAANTESESVKSIAFGACTLTSNNTCSTVVKIKGNYWTHPAAPSNWCYGCMCFRVCYRCNGCGSWQGSCLYYYVQPHGNTSQIQTTYTCSYTLNLGSGQCWQLMATQVGRTWHDSGIAFGSSQNCCCCRSIGANSASVSVACCLCWSNACINQQTASGAALSLGGSNPSSIYYTCVHYVWASYGANLCAETCKFGTGAQGCGRARACYYSPQLGSIVSCATSISCACGGSGFCTGTPQGASWNTSGNSVESNTSVSSFCVVARYDWDVCAQTSSGSWACSVGCSNVCGCTGSYLIQCYTVCTGGAASNEFCCLHSLTNTLATQTILDPTGCLNWLAIAYT